MKLPPGASDNVSGGIGLANGAFKHAELEIGPGVPPLPLPLHNQHSRASGCYDGRELPKLS